jgi:hypothetical protein
MLTKVFDVWSLDGSTEGPMVFSGKSVRILAAGLEVYQWNALYM